MPQNGLDSSAAMNFNSLPHVLPYSDDAMDGEQSAVLYSSYGDSGAPTPGGGGIAEHPKSTVAISVSIGI